MGRKTKSRQEQAYETVLAAARDQARRERRAVCVGRPVGSRLFVTFAASERGKFAHIPVLDTVHPPAEGESL